VRNRLFEHGAEPCYAGSSGTSMKANGCMLRSVPWRNIAIALIDKQKGE
jgi:hypothetical protein